jgi:hypothetical protein
MPYTLKVYVTPYEGKDVPAGEAIDRNVDLVCRGIPVTMVSSGAGKEPEKNIKEVGVQYVVVFELKGRELNTAQKEFLEHLHSKQSGNVVISGALYNEIGDYVRELF